MKEFLCKNLWDFNFKVGKNNISNDEIMKNYCIGIIIENGKCLLNFYDNENFGIGRIIVFFKFCYLYM